MFNPQPKPEKRFRNSRKPPKKMTSKREAIDREMKKAYERISKDRPARCEDCGAREFERSHLFPKAYDNYRYAAEDENIRLQCRDCHTEKWENGRIWKLKNGEAYMRYLLVNDEQYFYVKLYQMSDRAREENAELPGWALKFLGKTQ